MKFMNKAILLLLTSIALLAVSCDDYLDKQEDEAMTFDKIWTKRATTLQYFYNVWGFMPTESNWVDENPWIGASDEATCTYNRDYRYMNNGSWGPSTVPYNRYMHYYQAIREANIFMQNIDRCSAKDVNETEKKLWKVQARFARAYYNWLLMRMYGPIILVKDELVDFNQSMGALQRPRNTWEECVEYVCGELAECAKELPASPTTNDDYGMPTKGVCYAVIGRLKLYAARPLFNGNELYKNVKNPDGTNLFPVAYDKELWKEAADANYEVIKLGQYELYDTGDPVESYRGVGLVEWNSEIIFARWEGGYYNRVHVTPRVVGGTSYGGIAPTQQLVDAYAMSNGRYPITGYNADGTPVVDAASGYIETGTSAFVNPVHGYDVPNGSNRNMFKNREPRFYATVFWSSDWWGYGTGNWVNPVFRFNGNSGPGASHDYPKSGYMCHRFYDHTKNTNAGYWGNLTFPIYRLAETYLNYAEALNEYYGPSHPDILTYINKIRKRAGVPDLETVYPDCKTSQTLMRELIRKERRVELAFEGQRYFDTRTWMIAEETDGGQMWGMNTSAVCPNVSTTPEDFWKRTAFETRIFTSKHYLYPFSQRELDRNKLLTQNYGW